MGTASYAFSSADIARIAEFFDGSMDDVCRFLRDVWLPDAVATLQTIVRESDRAPARRLGFLCDHLREGARTVGARGVADLADELTHAILRGDRSRARALASNNISTLCLLSTRLPKAA